MTDTELLDGLERLGKGPWICRRSVLGRGLRVHETQEEETGIQFGPRQPLPTIREAIADFLEGEKNRPE